MILTVEQTRPVMQAVEVASTLLGKGIYAEWPHLKEVRVVAVADYNQRFDLVDSKPSTNGSNTEQFSIRRADLDKKEKDRWHSDASNIDSTYHKRKGVRIGETSVLVYACPLLGRKYLCGKEGVITMEKQWAPTPVSYAYQMTVKDIAVHDSTFKQFKTLAEVFPPGSECFMLGTPSYGALGKVLSTKEERVSVQFMIPNEPDFAWVMKNQERLGVRYFPAGVIAKKICVTSHIVSRITGTVFVLRGPKPSVPNVDSKAGEKIVIGLNLKYNKTNEEVPGYTRRTEEGQWLYSTKLMDILMRYIEEFPEVFHAMSQFSNSDVYYEHEVFGRDPSRLKELKDWLGSLECSKVMKSKAGQKMVEEPIVKMVEDEVKKVNSNKGHKKMKLAVRPHLLYRPFDFQGNLVPDPEAEYELFDRVINVREGYTVPLGLKGVVIGIQQGATLLDMLYDVIFDEEFAGGLKIRCSGAKGYRMPPTSLINISYGLRKEKGLIRGEKPLAVVKPHVSDGQADFFPFSQPALLPTSSAHHTQKQGWYADQMKRIGSAKDNTSERRQRQNKENEQRQEATSAPGVPSFASMVNNSNQSSGRTSDRNKKTGPTERGLTSSGPTKLTVLNTTQTGKPMKVLRKKEKADQGKREGSGPLRPHVEEVSKQNIRSSDKNQRTSQQAPSQSEVDDFANLWKKLQAQNESAGSSPSPDVSPELTPTPGETENPSPGNSESSSDFDWDQYPSSSTNRMTKETPRRKENLIKEEGASEKRIPRKTTAWVGEQMEEAEDNDDGDEEERLTPNTKARKDTEKLCEILNLPHLLQNVQNSLEQEEAAQRQRSGGPAFGKQISLQEIMGGASSDTTNLAPSNVPFMNPSNMQQQTLRGPSSYHGSVPPGFPPNQGPAKIPPGFLAHPGATPQQTPMYGMPSNFPRSPFPQGSQLRQHQVHIPGQTGPQPSAFHPFAKNQRMQAPFTAGQPRFMTPGQFYQRAPPQQMPPPSRLQHPGLPRQQGVPAGHHSQQRMPIPIGGRMMPNPTSQHMSPPQGYHIPTAGASSPRLPTSMDRTGADQKADPHSHETLLDKLRAFCASQGRRAPQYEYIETEMENEYFVVMYLPTGKVVEGQPCFGRRNAVECAAFQALQIMREEPPPTPPKPPGDASQFIPLQVTKKLTPKRPSASESSSTVEDTAPSSTEPETKEHHPSSDVKVKEEKSKGQQRSRGKRQQGRGGPKAKLAINFGGGGI